MGNHPCEQKQKGNCFHFLRRQNFLQEGLQAKGYKSRSEYIENAILFYNGFLHATHAQYYLPRVLGSTLQGTLGMFADRIGRLLFKQAVEENIGNHILAADTDMDVETYEKLRSRSIREVKETHGEISFKDDLIFQKSL